MSDGPTLSTSARRRARDVDAEPPERGARTARTNVRQAADVRPLEPGAEAGAKLRRLLAAVRGHRRAVVLTHDNPDPDSIAGAVGLAWLIEQLEGIPTKIAYGGIVGRAENRAMVKVLRLPLVPVSRIVFDEFDFIAIVDTQPECGNHSLVAQFPVDCVIDHHPARPSSQKPAFADVGGDYGATASILTSYVRAAGLTPSASIATALFYGIKTDTRDLGREFEPVDVDNYHWLFPLVDHGALSRIEHPEMPATYFAALHRAIAQARVHGEAVVTDLDEVYAPDIVAEVAERLLSLEDTRWSLSLGEYEGSVYISVRTSDRRMNAGRLVRDLIQDWGGSAGGHGSMAGGRVRLPEDADRKEIEAFKAKLVRAFLKEFGAPTKGSSLVADQ